jgi:hypothetical protein
MRFFMTEREIESLLASESRTLPTEDGQRVFVTAYRHVWDRYDAMTTGAGAFAPQKVVRWALMCQEENGGSLSVNFWCAVEHLYRVLTDHPDPMWTGDWDLFLSVHPRFQP